MPGGIHPPLEVIASWPAPNYHNPARRPRATTYLACVMSPIATFFIFARLWVRFYMQRNAGWDDWLMVAATPFIIALFVLIPYTADYPEPAMHIWDVDLTIFTRQRKLLLVIEEVFVVGTGLVKVSILLFFRRLGSRGVSKTFRIATWVAIITTALSTVAFAIAPLVGCRPLSAYWDQVDVIKIATGYQYHCFDEAADITVAGIISTIQDVVATIFPNLIYWKAQIPIRQKVALFSIFAIGYVVAIFGALRTYSLAYLFYGTYDVSWQLWEIYNWATLELHFGILCANAPALKVFVKRYLNITEIVRSKESSKSRSQQKSANSNNTNSSRPTVPSSKGTSSKGPGSKIAFWRNSFAHHGYVSQPTQISVDEHGGIRVNTDVDVT
ncbi:hypothetical protein DM02DRAFT_477774, partial [Periconia macrospinosa]